MTYVFRAMVIVSKYYIRRIKMGMMLGFSEEFRNDDEDGESSTCALARCRSWNVTLPI